MIATIAVPISTSLRSFSNFSWLTTTYVLGSSISQVLSGHLTDIFGRRKGLMVCYGLFALGTLLCGLAPDFPVFLTGRALQGIGGGSVCSITAFVETDLIPMQRRAFIEGLGNVCYGVVLALGGIYGAAINDAIGWKWAFLIQVPVIVLDGAAVLVVVKVSAEKVDRSSRRHLDFVGMITLLGAVTLFEFGLNSGSTKLIWARASVIAPCCIAATCFAIFSFWEVRHAKNPVIPIGALVERSVGLIQVSAFLATGCFVSCLFYIAVYLETLGLSSVATGLRLVPLSILFAIGSMVTGYLVQITHRYYHLNIVLQVISATAYGLLCTLSTKTPSWQPFVFLGILGIGVGGSYVTNLMGILTSVASQQQATVQAASWGVRAIGVASGLIISSVIFQNVSRTHLLKQFPDDSVVSEFSTTTALSTPAFMALSAPMKQMVVDAYMSAVHAVFYFLLAQAVVSVLVSVFIRNNVIPQATSAD
ncbi:MAG: hypothetical protein Q9175_001892 [Cornicularia normoerica]